MIQPYFNMQEIEEIINDEDGLAKFLKNNHVNESLAFTSSAPMAMSADEEGYEDEGYEEYEDEMEEKENDVENMSDKEKIKLAYEILSMTSYEDEFFMSILGRLRKLMR